MTDHVDLMTAWDEMDNAAQRVATSLPEQLSAAVKRLDSARLAMRKAVMATVMPKPKLAPIICTNRDLRNSGEAEGPSTSGYWTAGIDAHQPLPGFSDAWHLHAMEFHHKDKAEAERIRDLALTRLGY